MLRLHLKKGRKTLKTWELPDFDRERLKGLEEDIQGIIDFLDRDMRWVEKQRKRTEEKVIK